LIFLHNDMIQNSNKKKVAIIGAGIGGLATAILLAKKGYEVRIFEKNKTIGGRANVFEHNGFVFDMGPSWYLMPDVFEHFYNLVGENIKDHLDLIPLTPSYRAFFEEDGFWDIPADPEKVSDIFESVEPGAKKQFAKYLKQSSYQYHTAYQHFLFKNYKSIFDFFNWKMITKGLRMNILSMMDTYVQKFFSNDKIHKILQYTLVFLGSSPYNTPALYSLMSHVDFVGGVFYPKGGLYMVIESFKDIAEKNGIIINSGQSIERINYDADSQVSGVTLTGGDFIPADIVISNADMEHTEMKLIQDDSKRMYSKDFWDKAVVGPSGFILYVGLKEKLGSEILHHNLYFNKDWKANFDAIFDNKKIPYNPSFYVCCPTKSDNTIAPEGKDSLFILVPFPSGVEMNDEEKTLYQEHIIDCVSTQMNLSDLRSKIEYLRVYDNKNFSQDYNAFQGTALGLAHTLTQSASFRPKNKHTKIKNLYYVGAGTTPGVGMPMCLISAELVYKHIEGITHAEPLLEL
jgi:phytoene desaturase